MSYHLIDKTDKTRQNSEGKFNPSITIRVGKEESRCILGRSFNTKQEASAYVTTLKQKHIEAPNDLSDRKKADYICEVLCEIARIIPPLP